MSQTDALPIELQSPYFFKQKNPNSSTELGFTETKNPNSIKNQDLSLYVFDVKF